MNDGSNKTPNATAEVEIFTNDGVKKIHQLIDKFNIEASKGFGPALQEAQDAFYSEVYRQLQEVGKYIAVIAAPIKDEGGGHDYDGAMQNVWRGLHQAHGQEPTVMCILDVFSTNCALGNGNGGEMDEAPEKPLGRRSFPAALRLMIYKRDSYSCVYCGAHEDLSLDHIHPFSKGGPDDESNLQTLCMPCNIAKGTRSDESVRLSLGLAPARNAA